MDVEVSEETLHVDTLFDVLDKVCPILERPIRAPMRTRDSIKFYVHRILIIGDCDELIPEELYMIKGVRNSVDSQWQGCAFYMLRQKEERVRGATAACATKEVYTDKWHNTVTDAPEHRDSTETMIVGASQTSPSTRATNAVLS